MVSNEGGHGEYVEIEEKRNRESQVGSIFWGPRKQLVPIVFGGYEMDVLLDLLLVNQTNMKTYLPISLIEMNLFLIPKLQFGL